jgi:hypothetical protein
MSWRKWIVRGVVYGIVALCAVAALAYQRWTNPASVREQVIAKLQALFPGAEVSVDSARLRILGGIQLNGLRFYRRDDPERNELLHVPSAVIYHDKEKILDGELALRKVELYRPRLRLRRDRDGRWNVLGLAGPVDPSRALPTVVVHQGSILFEDRLDDGDVPLIEVGDINVTLINDPLPLVSVRGAASSEALGKLQVQGTVRREPLEVALTFQAQGVPITTALVRRLGGGRHAEALGTLEVEARADARGELAYRPGPDQPLYYDVRCTVSRGKVRHAQLPLPLDDLSATVRCVGNRLHLEALHARSGAAEVGARGSGTLPGLDQDFEAVLQVQHLELNKELCDRLPAKLHKLYDAFHPHGPTTVAVACARRGGQWADLADGTASRVSLRPEGASMAFVKFPYPVDRLTGAVDYNLRDERVWVDLAGLGGQRPVFIKGTWQGEGSQVEACFDIHAEDVPVDETLLQSLPDAAQKLARSFHATGRVDIKAHIRHDPGAAEYRNEYHVRLHDGTLLWDSFPYPLEQVSGVLDVYPGHWEFHEFRAARRGGQVAAHGRSTHGRAADGTKVRGIAVEITGKGLALDDELRKGLAPRPGLLKAWDTFRPQGRLNFVAAIDHPTDQIADLDVRVDAQGCAVEPVFFPYLLHDLGGHFHYHGHRLEVAQLRAWHGGALIALGQGAVDLHPGGGYYADLRDLEARDLQLDEDLLGALPRKLQDGARSLKLRDKVQARTRLVVSQAAEPGSPPDVFWEDSQAWLQNATLYAGVEMSGVTGTIACVGHHDGRQLVGLTGNLFLQQATAFKQPLRDVQANFQVQKKTPDVLLIGLRAPTFGGDVAGQIRLDFNSTLRYEANLTASQIDLAQLGRHNFPKSEVSGLAAARLHLTGQGSGVETLDGSGSIDVPAGKLLNLPILLDLLKFLGLHWPDRTAFEEVHALFGIRGTRVQLRRLDLLGNAISLAGKGEFNLDGTDLQVDFYPTWRVEQLLPPAVRPFPPAISKSLLTIEMRGKVGGNPEKDLKFNKRWVPILIDPVLDLQQRLVGDVRAEKKN